MKRTSQSSKRYFACDFETTVFEGQDYTEVWSAASVELHTEDVRVDHSIDDMFNYFFLLARDNDIVLYFHNLKFDGSFIIPYLISKRKMKQAFSSEGKALPVKYMHSSTFNYIISDMGQWYLITIKYGKHTIQIRDSLKLMPMSLKAIGKGYNTKHQKLDMEYTGFRYAGCPISPEEMEYIRNDVLVLKEALEIMFAEGHNRLTIGSCCMGEYKSTVDKLDWDRRFPDVYKMELDDILKQATGNQNVGEYIHESYRGGWCYLVRGKECKVFEKGVTCDVNSLYPSMMHSESGNIYPVGTPNFWIGDYIPDEALQPDRYYFIRVKTRFYIKDGYLPFIQIKHSMLYKSNEMLETSDVYNEKYYHNQITNEDGEIIDTRVTLTMTMTDWILFNEHYDLVDCEILSGCWFFAEKGIFDDYINKYREIKTHSKGAKRTIAKLFLNNLYGKMATSPDSSHKLADIDEDIILHFTQVKEMDKRAGYIPIGSAITSYARNFTIRAAQKNYHGKYERGFIYADTDSIHCNLDPDDVVGIKIHPTDFCAWKMESTWDKAWFVRQKTYIEHIVENDREPCEPYYDIKCAGMPDACKKRVLAAFNGEEIEDKKDDEVIPTSMEEFHVGIKVWGKLKPKRISGGVVLQEEYYTMKGDNYAFSLE